jgi:hypothetical protein
MAMPTPPRRRWFQFGLRTMFVVVTAICLWLGWSVHWAHERSRMVALIHTRPQSDRGNIGFYVELKPLPLSLRLLRVERQWFMPLQSGCFTREEVQRIIGLFPEAYVCVYGPDPQFLDDPAGAP